MKKVFRVTRNEEFSRIISEHHSKASATFVVYYSKAIYEYDRIGISVSKKLGNAVERNKIKRQLRSMIDATISFHEGYDLIIIVRNKFNENVYEENKKELNSIISKVYNRNVTNL